MADEPRSSNYFTQQDTTKEQRAKDECTMGGKYHESNDEELTISSTKAWSVCGL